MYHDTKYRETQKYHMLSESKKVDLTFLIFPSYFLVQTLLSSLLYDFTSSLSTFSHLSYFKRYRRKKEKK